MHIVRVVVSETVIGLGTLFVSTLLESPRAQRIAYGVGIAVALLVLLVLHLWERRRPKPDFERVERTVKRRGRTEVHWEEHKYGRTEVVEGRAMGTARSSARAKGSALKTFPVECSFNEGMWWLILDKEDEDVAFFRVVVTDPLGGGGRKEFAQAGRRIVVRYPEDFKIGIPSDEARQPWGRYWVSWDVFRLTEDKQDVWLEGKGSCEFDWKDESTAAQGALAGWVAGCETVPATLSALGKGIQLTLRTTHGEPLELGCMVTHKSGGRYEAQPSIFDDPKPRTEWIVQWPAQFEPKPPIPWPDGLYEYTWTGTTWDLGEDSESIELARGAFRVDKNGATTCL